MKISLRNNSFSAQITFNPPANGNDVAFNKIPEDTTNAAVTAEENVSVLLRHGVIIISNLIISNR